MNFSKKLRESFLQQNTFAIYGLGVTGRSVINFFKKKSGQFFYMGRQQNSKRCLWSK